MKRKAVLIGNTRNLSGTPKDLAMVARHLVSYQGGGWVKDEIEIFIDEPASFIVDKFEKIRDENNDFVIVYFTGHGMMQGNTITEVNLAQELIDEDVLFGLAERQINILDCCRGVVTTPVPIFRRRRSMVPVNSDEIEEVRKQYDDLIMNGSAPQFVRMYSCDANESSYCLSNGSCSYYTRSLMDSISDILKKDNIARVYACHQEAAIRTTDSVLNDLKQNQHPVIIPAKCAAAAELPLGFNPVLSNKS